MWFSRPGLYCQLSGNHIWGWKGERAGSEVSEKVVNRDSSGPSQIEGKNVPYLGHLSNLFQAFIDSIINVLENCYGLLGLALRRDVGLAYEIMSSSSMLS